MAINRERSGYLIKTKDEEEMGTNIVINSAGLYSDKISEMIGIDPVRENYRIKYCKGDYFYYSKSPLVSRLIYPLHYTNLKGLGIHITLDLGGRMKFGPSAYFVDKIDYSVEPSKRDFFYESASKLVSNLDKNFIYPDMSGKYVNDLVRGYFI